MARDVFFKKGTQADYNALSSKNENTFYNTGENVYLGTQLLTSTADLEAALVRLGIVESLAESNEAAINTANTNITNLTDTVDSLTSTVNSQGTQITNIITDIGSLDNLNTGNKSSLVNAINECLQSINSGIAEETVSITESSDENYAKVYTFTQGGNTIGTVNVPKDMVVESGTVEVNPSGQESGTYIVLTIANSNGDKLYINVGDLVDVYTAQGNAAQVQIAINDNIISASIVAGSIGTTELADGAVSTDKLADGTITEGKLSAELQQLIESGGDAVKSVTTGTANGTISVDGVNVSVYGLGSAAYTDSSEYDTAGAASEVLGSSSDGASANTVYGAKAYADSLIQNLDISVITDEEILALFANS